MNPILILGPPGAGKGTQAALIAQRYVIPHISTGELLRLHIAANDAIGKAVKEIVSRGGLVQDNLLMPMVASRTSADDCKNGYILDGFPRTVVQAAWLAPRITPIVLQIDVTFDTLMKRLLIRGRMDDKEETIKERIKEYDEQTRPVVSYYESKGQLHWIDGNRELEQVQEQIISALGTSVLTTRV